MGKKGSKNGDAVKLRTAVLCDAIRREADNKWLLIGCYSEAVNVNVSPSFLQMAIFAVLEVTADGVTKVEVQIKCPSGVSTGVVSSGGAFPVGAVLELPATAAFLAEAEGDVSIRWRADDGEWNDGVGWKIQISPSVQALPDDVAAKIREGSTFLTQMAAAAIHAGT